MATIDGLSIGGEAVSLAVTSDLKTGRSTSSSAVSSYVRRRLAARLAYQAGSIATGLFRLPAATRSNSATTSLLGRIVLAMENVAVEAILKSLERISQHTRIFRYIVGKG